MNLRRTQLSLSLHYAYPPGPKALAAMTANRILRVAVLGLMARGQVPMLLSRRPGGQR